MTNHVMKVEPIPGTLGTDQGYRLCFVEQATDAAVANDDTLTFKNVKHVIPVAIVSEDADIIVFDASAASSSDWVLTVDTSVATKGLAATRVEGTALVKF